MRGSKAEERSDGGDHGLGAWWRLYRPRHHLPPPRRPAHTAGKHHAELESSWKRGRSRVRWITPPSNAVWRIKSLLDDNVLLCTSRTEAFGLVAIDRSSSQLLFSIKGVASWTHLEAGRGFAVFDRAEVESDDDDVFAATNGELLSCPW